MARRAVPGWCAGCALTARPPAQLGQVKRLLDNKTGEAGIQEKLEGMKWLLAVRIPCDVRRFVLGR